MPKSRILSLIATEPVTLLRAGLRALPQLQDWSIGYLGRVEGLQYAGGNAVRAAGGVFASSVAQVVGMLSMPLFLQILAASAAIFVASAAVCLLAALSRRRAPLALALYALTGIAWYAIVSSIFGDGYVEIPRHAQLAGVALCATFVLMAASLLSPLLRVFGLAVGRAIVPGAAFVLLAIATAVLSRAPLEDAMDVTPMAFGVVDRPLSNKVSPDGVEFWGWAIDPKGVAQVDLLVDGATTITAHYGLSYLGARGEPLTLYFPGYPNTAAAGFRAVLPAQALSYGGADVRTVVVNTAGQRTEIDRRHMVPDAR
jgi:hypothetical protein